MEQSEEKEFKLSEELELYFSNWSKAYKFGQRDAYLAVHATNFVGEGYGFVGGYILGYGAALEKLKGPAAQNQFHNDFLSRLKTRQIAFTPYDDRGNEITFEEWIKNK